MRSAAHGLAGPSLARAAFPYLKTPPRIEVGYAMAVHNPLVHPERIVRRRAAATRCGWPPTCGRREELQMRERLLDIILRERIVTAYQPIMDLKTRTVLGFEALSRGAAGLGPGARRRALRRGRARTSCWSSWTGSAGSAPCCPPRRIPSTAKIFVNTLPATIRDPQFRGKALIDFLDRAQVSPDRIVIEITEKLVIDNYTLFREAMAYFTDLGMSFAVDDVGAGYSGLESIARLKPTYLKIDIALVRDVHASLVNREMVKAIIAMGARHRRHRHRGGHPDRGGSARPPRHGRELGPGLPAGAPRAGARARLIMRAIGAAAALSLLAATPAPAIQHLDSAPLLPVTRLSAGPVVIGDFNGDGRRDLAYGLHNPTGVAVTLGDGQGGYGVPLVSQIATSTSSSAEAIVAADFNADGRLDVALADFATGPSVYLGLGDGRFAGSSLGGDPLNLGLATGDFDGDGRRDLAMSHRGFTTVAQVLFYRGDGAGAFAAPNVWSLPMLLFPVGLVARDFNGDGRDDVAVADNFGNAVAVLLGSATLVPTVRGPFPSGDGAMGIDAGDLDGDGRLDVVTADERWTHGVGPARGRDRLLRSADHGARPGPGAPRAHRRVRRRRPARRRGVGSRCLDLLRRRCGRTPSAAPLRRVGRPGRGGPERGRTPRPGRGPQPAGG